MANITGLAIKISANISDLTKNATEVIASIDKIAKVAGNATPSMRNLEDAAKGYMIMLDAMTAAEERVNNAWMEDYGESIEIMNETWAKTEKLKEKVQNLGTGVSDDILKMKPTVNNVMEAQKQVEKLKQIATTTGIDISASIAQAEANLGQLTNSAVQSQVAMQSFKSVVFSFQNMPFLILMEVLKEITGWVKDIAATWDSKLNGIPSVILKTGAALLAAVTLTGILNSQMLGVATSTAYWQTLIKTNVIYIGACTIATAAWTAAQWVLNVAMTANPIGVIVAGLVAAVVLVTAMVLAVRAVWSWWNNSAKAADESKQRIAAMEASTSSFRDRIGESVDRFKELNNLARQYHEANLTGAEKYQNKLKEIDDVLNKQNVANSAIGNLNLKEIELVRAMGNAKGNKDLIASLQKQLDDIRGDRSALAKEMQNSPALSAGDAAAARQEAANQFNQSLGIDGILKPVETAATIYAGQMENLGVALKMGTISQDQYTSAVDRITDEYNKSIPFVDAAAEMQKKMAELADNLGITEFINPKQIDTMESVQSKILEYYNQLDGLGKATFDLTAAQQRVTESFEKQSEFYSLYESAQKALNPDTLAAAMSRLHEQAEKFGWAGDTLAKMEEQLAEKFAETDPEADAAGGKQAKQSSTNNAALERGTMAYISTQNAANNPQLKEQQRQTKIQQQIATNTKPKQESSNYELTLIS